MNLRRTLGLASSLNSLKLMLMRLELRGRKHFLKQRYIEISWYENFATLSIIHVGFDLGHKLSFPFFRLLQSVKQANLRMKSEKNKKRRKEKRKKKTDASSHLKSERPYLVVKECKHKMNVFIYSNINFSHNLLLWLPSSDASSCFPLKKAKTL